jgi:uncharacterized protein (DUF433 family)
MLAMTIDKIQKAEHRLPSTRDYRYHPGMATHSTPPMTTSSETVVPVIAEHIVKTPGVCSGEPRVAGTRIKVKHIYLWHERMGMTPAQIVAEYPQLTRAAVHAALAYYWGHQDEIHRDMEEEEKLVAELKAKTGPSRLQERLAESNATDDSVSS